MAFGFDPPGNDASLGSIKVIDDHGSMVDPANLDVTFVILCGRFGEGEQRNTGVVCADLNGLIGFHPGAHPVDFSARHAAQPCGGRLWVRNDHVDVF